MRSMARLVPFFLTKRRSAIAGACNPERRITAMAPSPGGVEIAAMVSSASTLGACRLGRAVFQQALGIQAPQLGNKAPVLIQLSDRNTKPFRQFVLRIARTMSPAEEELRKTLSPSPTRTRTKFARSGQIRDPSMKARFANTRDPRSKLTRFAECCFLDSCQGFRLRDAVRIEWLACF